MRRFFACGFIAVLFSASQGSAQRLSIDTVAVRVHTAFAASDFTALGKWFADTVLFDGEVQVLMKGASAGMTLYDSTVVVRSGEILERGWIAATLTSTALTTSYNHFANKVGRPRLTAILKQRPWKLLRSDRDGFPYRHVKAGDYVTFLHLRTDEPPEVLDEAVVFVFRQVDGAYRIVAHLADF
jgi:hypothetical protein